MDIHIYIKNIWWRGVRATSVAEEWRRKGPKIVKKLWQWQFGKQDDTLNGRRTAVHKHLTLNIQLFIFMCKSAAGHIPDRNAGVFFLRLDSCVSDDLWCRFITVNYKRPGISTRRDSKRRADSVINALLAFCRWSEKVKAAFVLSAMLKIRWQLQKKKHRLRSWIAKHVRRCYWRQ